MSISIYLLEVMDGKEIFNQYKAAKASIFIVVIILVNSLFSTLTSLGFVYLDYETGPDIDNSSS